MDDWTVERHLREKPAHVVALYHRFIALAEACGPFDHAVAKTAVSLKGRRRGFAGAVPTAKALDGHFDLQRQVFDPRIRRSSLPAHFSVAVSSPVPVTSWHGGDTALSSTDPDP